MTSKNQIDLRYQNGKIYKIFSNQEPQLCYIGSTFKDLKFRFNKHLYDFNTWKNDKAKPFCTSYKILEKYNDCIIELLKPFPCKNRTELLKEEGKFQKTITCVNQYIAGRTSKEYWLDNRANILERYRIKSICDVCGLNLNIYSKPRHNKSKKHINNNQMLISQL